MYDKTPFVTRSRSWQGHLWHLDPYQQITWLLKIERIFCPRKLFSGSNSSPESNAGRRTDFRDKKSSGFFWRDFSKRRKLLPKRVLFLETKEHPQISNASFWKRGRENVFLQMFLFWENESTPQPINGNKVVGAVMLLPKFLSRKKLSRKYRSIFASKISPATGDTSQPPKPAPIIALWSATNRWYVVKCVSQKRNQPMIRTNCTIS